MFPIFSRSYSISFGHHHNIASPISVLNKMLPIFYTQNSQTYLYSIQSSFIEPAMWSFLKKYLFKYCSLRIIFISMHDMTKPLDPLAFIKVICRFYFHKFLQTPIISPCQFNMPVISTDSQIFFPILILEGFRLPIYSARHCSGFTPIQELVLLEPYIVWCLFFQTTYLIYEISFPRRKFSLFNRVFISFVKSFLVRNVTPKYLKSSF